MSRSKRIAKELEDVKADPNSGIDIAFVNESDMSHLKGTFQGPPDTPYSGGEFVIDIQIPQECKVPERAKIKISLIVLTALFSSRPLQTPQNEI